MRFLLPIVGFSYVSILLNSSQTLALGAVHISPFEARFLGGYPNRSLKTLIGAFAAARCT